MKETPILNDIVSRFLKVSDKGVQDAVRAEVIDPMRDEQARVSVLKREIVRKLADQGLQTTGLTAEEYDVFSRHRFELARRIRDRRKSLKVSAEDCLFQDARNDDERRAIVEYLNR